MRHLWMGIVAGPMGETRVLVQNGPAETILKARLPAPEHERAIPLLCESLALWCGRKVRVAIAAEGPGGQCVLKPWLASLDVATRGPLFEVELVSRVRRPRERDGLGGLGDFRDVRQLVLFEVAR